MDLKVNEPLIIDYKLLSKLYIFDLAVNIIEPPRTNTYMSEAIWCPLLNRQKTPTEFFRQLLGGAALPQSNTLTIQLKFKTKHLLPVHTL